MPTDTQLATARAEHDCPHLAGVRTAHERLAQLGSHLMDMTRPDAADRYGPSLDQKLDSVRRDIEATTAQLRDAESDCRIHRPDVYPTPTDK